MPDLGPEPLDAATLEYLETASDSELLRLHSDVVNQTMAQVGRLQREQKRLANKLDVELGERLFFRRDGTDITSRSKRSVDVAVRRTMAQSNAAFEKRLVLTTLQSTVAKARTVAAVLRDRGFQPVSSGRVDQIALSVARDNSKFFGMRPTERIQDVTQRHESRLRELIREQTGGTSATFTRSLGARERILASGSVGINSDPTPGGSVVKDMTRIMVAESMRKAHEVEKKVMRESGVEFAYRRLSAGHTSHGSAEVCEELNSDVFGGIDAMLSSAGYDPALIDVRGLYPLSDMPDYPHAFCKCWAEPLPPPE